MAQSEGDGFRPSVVLDEFDEWLERRQTGPALPVRLPDGWVEIARSRVGEDRVGEDRVLVLIRRDLGGWISWVYDEVDGLLGDPRPAATLEDLYGQARGTSAGRAMWSLLGAAYDPRDPVEAAEATLVALGAVPTVTPRSWLP